MIRKLKSGEYRLYSRKVDPKTNERSNLGTFKTPARQQEKHEREDTIFQASLSRSWRNRRCSRWHHIGRATVFGYSNASTESEYNHTPRHHRC